MPGADGDARRRESRLREIRRSSSSLIQEWHGMGQASVNRVSPRTYPPMCTKASFLLAGRCISPLAFPCSPFIQRTPEICPPASFSSLPLASWPFPWPGSSSAGLSFPSAGKTAWKRKGGAQGDSGLAKPSPPPGKTGGYRFTLPWLHRGVTTDPRVHPSLSKIVFLSPRRHCSCACCCPCDRPYLRSSFWPASPSPWLCLFSTGL